MSRLFSKKVSPTGKVFAMDTDKYYIKYSPEELKETINMPPLKTIRVGDYFYMQAFKIR